MDLLSHLGLGIATAATGVNLFYCLAGVFLGTAIGVLPGLGPVATIAMLLPVTFGLPPETALIMLAGIFYGAQYGGSTTAILVVIMALGYGHTWLAIWVLPLGFLVGLTFGAAGLVMNALAPNYDFFTYFFTLVLTPMLLLSGVYFPVDQMPAWIAAACGPCWRHPPRTVWRRIARANRRTRTRRCSRRTSSSR